MDENEKKLMQAQYEETKTQMQALQKQVEELSKANSDLRAANEAKTQVSNASVTMSGEQFLQLLQAVKDAPQPVVQPSQAELIAKFKGGA